MHPPRLVGYDKSSGTFLKTSSLRILLPIPIFYLSLFIFIYYPYLNLFIINSFGYYLFDQILFILLSKLEKNTKKE